MKRPQQFSDPPTRDTAATRTPGERGSEAVTAPIDIRSLRRRARAEAGIAEPRVEPRASRQPAASERPGAPDASDPAGAPGEHGASESLGGASPYEGFSIGRPTHPSSAHTTTAPTTDPPTATPPTPALPAAAPARRRLGRLARRAQRREARRFTRRSRRRRATWWTVVGIAATLALLLLVGVYSPVFAVREIRVVGTDRLDADAVEQALAEQFGTPLPLVDEGEVLEALEQFPLIETYSTESRLPGTLLVRVEERTPLAAVRQSDGWTVVDAAGVTLESGRGDGLPRVELGDDGVDGEAFEAGVRVLLSLPNSVRDRVERVEATTLDDVRLRLRGTSTVVLWGSDERAEYKAAVLDVMLTDPVSRDASQIDVSIPSNPTWT